MVGAGVAGASGDGAALRPTFLKHHVQNSESFLNNQELQDSEGIGVGDGVVGGGVGDTVGYKVVSIILGELSMLTVTEPVETPAIPDTSFTLAAIVDAKEESDFSPEFKFDITVEI
jgi:hypothetical protein